MRAIVTGAAGFVGSSLSEAVLDRGGSVVGVDCFTDYYARAIKERNLGRLRDESRFRLVEDNILNVDWAPLLAETDVVFHQAAQAGVRASWGAEFRNYTDWNVLGTQRLLEAIKALPVADRPRVVYASSSSVYGERTNFPFFESDRPAPISPYGVTKLAAEHLAVLYAHNFGVETVSLRYFTVYGPRQRPDMAFHKFLRAIIQGEELPIYGDGLQTRDFTYVSDAISANFAAAENGRPGGVYNIGGGSQVTVNHTLEVLAKVSNRPVKINRMEKQHGDVTHTAAATTLANEELAWKPQVSLEEGLSRELPYVEELIAAGL